MIAAPAVDLRGGRCVQLVGGKPEAEAISLPDPEAVALSWHATGFDTLHVVDLDAALGSGDNLDTVLRLVAATPATTQVGGGIRDDARADALLDAGVDRIIVGTRALDDPAWLASLARRAPARVMIALDTREGRILRKGWQEATALELTAYLAELAELPLAGVLSTDVGREGRMKGIDRAATAEAARVSSHPMWISGGVTTLADLEHIDATGAAGAVLGMALYTDTLNAAEVARRWGRTTATHEGHSAPTNAANTEDDA